MYSDVGGMGGGVWAGVEPWRGFGGWQVVGVGVEAFEQGVQGLQLGVSSCGHVGAMCEVTGLTCLLGVGEEAGPPFRPPRLIYQPATTMFPPAAPWRMCLPASPPKQSTTACMGR